MKKIILAASVLLISATASFANNNKGTEDDKKAKKEARKETREENKTVVSNFMKQQFYQDFPSAKDIRFERTANFDEASFTEDSHRVRAYYDIHNELVGTTERKSLTDLPENAQRAIQKKYGDYSVVRVIRYDDNEANETDMTMFDTAFDGADNDFVVLRKNSELLILKVNLAGDVSFFKSMK